MTETPLRGEATGRRRPDLLSPRILAELGGLEFVARHVVEGFLLGLHRSPHRGFSAEFAEHRAYQPGDDLRYVDWRMYGRSDRFYVKQFEEETNLRAEVVLDVSASMAWTSDAGAVPPKLWYGKQLAACLIFILLRQGDTVGLTAYDERIRVRLAPRGGRKHWYEMVRVLGGLAARGRTSAPGALRNVAARLARRGLVLLISDLLVDPEETLLALRYLRHRGHEVLVFHLLDPGERELPGRGEVRLFDPETGEELSTSIPHVRREYREAVERALHEWSRRLRGHGIDYAVVDTDRSFSLALRAYLRKRERLS